MLLWASILLGTGLLAGLVGGLLGIGGCSIILPVLIFIYNYSEPVAIGTTITAVIITAASGAIAHIRIKNVDHKTSAIINVAGSLGAALGSIILVYIMGQLWLLDVILGLAFIYTSVRMIYEGALRKGPGLAKGSKTSLPEAKVVPGSSWVKAILGFGVGVITGIVGLGGGYMLMPLYIYVLHSPVKIAVGTSLESFIGQAVVSSGFKLYQGIVDIMAAICLGVGTAIGAQIGARLVPKVPAWSIKALFGIIFLVVSIKFLCKGLGIPFM
ncbi:MAG: sulfite exporter TauE/SafE family protein [Candidatus Methanomethylicota archaeon]|uniref:Probable membrane transporter protein n=1 Tax=Thermoproteota archaeon TaxID=2056631 RepID=A0A497EN27_9CREN|nr:MAG: sulfite exporter TauE/SafE family protein [Candidatus Verstraetearchaeota archaeon]RLE52310.1 MAG: sulfite exporter TauE/SafE family protein [Candidatus Verstraetearchaeota archaeon]